MGSASLKTIAIANENSIAKFSMPEESLTYAPTGNSLVNVFKNGDRERKIHCNVELPEDELKTLKELQDMAKEANAVFLPLMTVRATRYITTARGDVPRALAMMQATNEFYHEQFSVPCSEELLAEELKHGIAYWCGRDNQLRPALVFRANRIPHAWHKAGSYDKVVRVVTFCFEYFFRYMHIPGRVESFSVIIDLEGLGITQIPVAALKEMHKSMANHYTVRVTKMYICNMSMFLRGVFAIAKSVITERQNQKLCVVTSPADLLADFAVHQLEKDFGGSKDNVKQTWPFQLNPGPFTAGYKGGPNPKAVPYVHEAFAPEEILGRLWDPTLSFEENTHHVYTKSAPLIYRKCGLPVPEGCPLPDEDLEQPTENEPTANELGAGNDPKQNDVEDQLNESSEQVEQGINSDAVVKAPEIEETPLEKPVVKEDVDDDKQAPFKFCGIACCGGKKKRQPKISSV